MKKITRSEQEIFAELKSLCCRPGFVHVVAHFCFRDNVIVYAGNMKEADMSKMFSPSRLIRTEINTLLGLMIKADIDWTLPAPKTVQEYMDTTEQLLEELHYGLSAESWSGLTKEAVENGFNPFDRGESLREPIFYSGEAAYSFQYLDLSVRKYAADVPWLQANRGLRCRTFDDVRNDLVHQVKLENFEVGRVRRVTLTPNGPILLVASPVQTDHGAIMKWVRIEVTS